MGVTYKAFDVDLHCPVTLKVIAERYLGDESARLRFRAKRVPPPASVTRMLRQSSTWVESVKTTFTPWSLLREKRSKSSSNVPVGWR
jgi:hypothetical protein